MAVRMNKREQISVLCACVLVVCFLLFQFGISPLLEEKKLLERQLEVKTKIFADMIQLAAEYDTIVENNKNLKQSYSKRDKNFTLFAFLEKLAGSAGIKDSIAYMKPSTTVDKSSDIEYSLVEMKLKQIKLSQLISYLHMVETSENVVFVKRLGITKDDKNKNSISAVLHVETVKN
jgi:general secretion pathway protein M